MLLAYHRATRAVRARTPSPVRDRPRSAWPRTRFTFAVAVMRTDVTKMWQAKAKNPWFYKCFLVTQTAVELSASGPGRSLVDPKRVISYGFPAIALPAAPARFRAFPAAPWQICDKTRLNSVGFPRRLCGCWGRARSATVVWRARRINECETPISGSRLPSITA